MFGLKGLLKQFVTALRLPPHQPPVVIARPPIPVPPPPLPADPVPALALLAATNTTRKLHGLAALVIDDRLTAAAAWIALDNATHRHLSHRGTDGSDPQSRIAAVGFPAAYTPVGPENGFAAPAWVGGPPDWGTAVQAVDAWLNSTDGHRETLLGAWTHMGGATAVGADGSVYWFADYGVPKP